MQHQTNLTAVVGHLELADVGAVQLDHPIAQVVKAANQIDQRAFPRATVAHQTNHLARLNVEVELPYHGTVAVAKARIAHRDVAFDLGRQSHWVARLGHAGDVVQDVKNAFGPRGRFLRVRDDAAHGIEAGIKATDVGQKRGQHTHRDLVVRHQPDAKAPDHQQADFGHQCHRRREQRPDAVEPVIDLEVVCIGVLEALGFAVFLRKSFDHPDARDGVGQHIGHFGPDAVDLFKAGTQFFAHHMDQPANEGQRQQGHQRQSRVDVKQDDGRHQNHQHIGGKVQQVQGQEHVDAVGLAADAGDQITGAPTAKILQREFEQMFVGGGAQIGPDALGHQRQDVGFDPTEPPGQQTRSEQTQQVQGHQPGIDVGPVLVRNQHLVHQWHGQVGRHQGGGGRGQSQQKTEQQRTLVGSCKAPELEQGPSGWRVQVFAAADGAFVIVLGQTGLAHRAQGQMSRLQRTPMQIGGPTPQALGGVALLRLKLRHPAKHRLLQPQCEAPNCLAAVFIAQLQLPDPGMVRLAQSLAIGQRPALPFFFAQTGREDTPIGQNQGDFVELQCCVQVNQNPG